MKPAQTAPQDISNKQMDPTANSSDAATILNANIKETSKQTTTNLMKKPKKLKFSFQKNGYSGRISQN